MRRLAPLAVALLAGCAGAPSYMTADGPVAARARTLGWVLTAAAIAIMVLVVVLLLAALFRRRGDDGEVERERTTPGLRWILLGGVALPVVVLVPVFVYSTLVLGAVSRPGRSTPITVRVVGHRWWWEFEYAPGRPERSFVTANELHVPVGVPVELELESGDVIHSFWVPQLAGKTDLVPGNRNRMWLQADEPGVYLGQCAEFCGAQHALMRMRVVAEDRAHFDAWYRRQLQPAPPPRERGDSVGLHVFMTSACVTCHTIRGTGAGGLVGPDLTHFASRLTLAAGVLANTRGHLAGWIADPQAIKPGNYMPRNYLEGPELQALVGYLQTLR
jgi:cytochrome c oxidase subunit 2